MFAYAGIAALIAGSALVRAAPEPSAPGPGDVFKQGEQCTISWSADTTGTWKEMNIELMTGDNWHMVHITTVATLDATDASQTTFSYDCPEVTPNSAIYFYQFSSPAEPKNIMWTTRFTIAGADGSTVPPENDTEPDGQNIPWGVGALVDPSKAVAAPSYLASGSSSGSTTVTGSSGATGTSTGTVTAGPAAGTTSATTSGRGTAPTAPAAPTTSSAANTTTTNSNVTAAGADNGALNVFGVDNTLARAGIALAVAAFTFAVAL
ncbi:hypothetical protein C8Q80DRAFT_585163 [Daedaleopsis nitida]|nr:hypothetical protein C8Q80DRAFT_585163 [Daedaleopsis nitida]